MRMWAKVSAMALLGATLLGGVAVAQDAQKAIAYRQGIMKANAWHIGAISAMAKGNVDFDKAMLQHHADALAALAKMTAEGFPTGSVGIDGTKAKMEIDSDHAGFLAKDKAFIDATAALAAGAGGVSDAAGIGALLGPVGGACGGCHETFKSK